MCRAVQGPEGMILPVRLDIPFAPAAGVEACAGGGPASSSQAAAYFWPAHLLGCLPD
jgi:hypothetical protein